ncbi:hypothetical protein G6R29_01725 [Fructobacillus sp. M2-14]|uniref:Uncharacterized protein n=1 Tax=Fructobacillus broussonetiae TaxID=2713173 RepID=A0ABS5R1F3_9LACO|nr:hypothetical protein [Fructobacillus broussonetiae]MBS9338354.1 hypothetical protein [Fructobacillus broussonetiae]
MFTFFIALVCIVFFFLFMIGLFLTIKSAFKFFVTKSVTKKQLLSSVIGTFLFLLIFGVTAVPTFGNSSDNTKKVSTKSDGYDFKSIKLGMTQKEVSDKLGKPSSQNDRAMTYGNNTLYFADGKLTGGSPKFIQQQVNQKNSNDKQKKADDLNSEKSAAQYFGSKSTQKLAEQASYVPRTQMSNGNMMYSETISNVKMYRIDDYQTGVTTVYKADESKDDGLGAILYQGKTVTQEKPKTTIVY